MAAIDQLIDNIEDPVLRERIKKEVLKLQKQKKFGLVFEEHIPEATPLYDVPVKRGSRVMLRGGNISEVYKVISISGESVLCERMDETHIQETFAKSDLIVVAHFGEPIFPYLKYKDSICNAPDSDLWHTLIEADNYHALQLLTYLYAGQVDCIYIDPPYNTGARDWKYNNDYVDSTDAYRHSKWLSMMEKRLKLAKKLLNPKDSVLIVTIDEKEYLHLGCLLEQMFPEARMQMVSSVINPKGNRRDDEFSRCEEYIYFVYIGNSTIISNGQDMLREVNNEDNTKDKSIRLRALLRGASNHGRRIDRPNLFYPLYFEEWTGKFMGCGESIPLSQDRNSVEIPDKMVAMWPIGANGTELTWNLQPETLRKKNEQHFLSFSKWDGQKRVGYYLSAGQEENFRNGMYNIVGTDEDGAYIIELKSAKVNDVRPLTIWHKKSHSASEYGTTFLNKIIGGSKFTFPKSLYAVRDTIQFFIAKKPNALILDFFAGSGTTMHAVNLLNTEDGGHRRCILVTNNEVSDDEAKSLTAKGYKAGDAEWEKLGIANYVTWERTKCTIIGKDVNGNSLKGNYLGSDIPMADGFKANAIFFKLGFLDKTSVSLGRQLTELIPMLWMKAGAKGECPNIKGDEDYVILPANKFAVLINECEYSNFEKEIREHSEIEVAYIITNSESGYREMIAGLKCKDTYQLYRDYLDNFSINYSR